MEQIWEAIHKQDADIFYFELSVLLFLFAWLFADFLKTH